MKTVVVLCFVAAGLAACDGTDPVADGANNIATADIDVLPPDESVATPTNELQSGDDEDMNAAELPGDNSDL